MVQLDDRPAGRIERSSSFDAVLEIGMIKYQSLFGLNEETQSFQPDDVSPAVWITMCLIVVLVINIFGVGKLKSPFGHLLVILINMVSPQEYMENVNFSSRPSK